MFTGIVQQTGRVEKVQRAEGGVRLAVAPAAPLADLKIGESICTDGVCLTAEPGSTPDRILYFLSEETLSRTTLGSAAQGTIVNLERSLAAGDRLGGHLVMGHVDGVGTIRRLDRRGESWDLQVETPAGLVPFLAPKGSISVDGISLTVVDVLESGFTVAVIPHTHEVTSLRNKAAGSPVNLEVDMIARYVVQYLGNLASGKTVDLELLKRAGFA